MTNVRRPIHLQLQRPSAMVSSASGPGPFGENSDGEVSGSGHGADTPMSIPAGGGQGNGGPVVSGPTRGTQPTRTTPIRPTALINFKCTQPPTIKSPSVIGPTCCVLSGSHRPYPATRAHHHHQHHQHQCGITTTPTTATTKALSPSGLNDTLPSQIMTHLYVGNQEQTNRDTLNKLNITYILSLGLLPMITATQSTATTTTTTLAGTGGTTHKTKDQQQPILMPLQNSSSDFKIKIRTSNTATSTTPTTTTTSPTTSGNCIPTSTSTTASTTQQTSRDENEGVKQVRSIHCKCINISDNSDQLLSKFFDEAYMFIEEARRKKCNILIHCLAGISRSPTMAIAYLMRLKSLHWRDAYALVKQCRPQIDPNLNFMGQLRIYNRSLRGQHKQQTIANSSNNKSVISPVMTPTNNITAVTTTSVRDKQDNLIRLD